MTDATAGLLGQPWWIMLTTVLTMLLVVTLGTAGAVFDLRRRRLPEATRWEDLTQRVAGLDVELAKKHEELRRVEQMIHDRDRLAAEVATLTERLAGLRVELSGLVEAERQVEEMQHRAANAAEEFAQQQGKLEEARAELAELERKAEDARRVLASVPVEIEQLRRDAERLREERTALDGEVATLRAERGDLLAAREEVAALGLRKAQLEQDIERSRREADEGAALRLEVERLRAEQAGLFAARDEMAALTARREGLEQAIERLRYEVEEGGRISAELDRLRAEQAALLVQRDETASLTARREGLEQEVGRLQRKVDAGEALLKEVERLRAEHAQLLALQAEVSVLQARKAALEQVSGSGGAGQDGDIEDLKNLPACLPRTPGLARDPLTEHQALEDVGIYLKDLGLKYDRRRLAAFHTALKINDAAQMTILAGVSGTGKSLLPRRYAEAMGLHFLQIAVEPRWDSPQDLLGFYNYIEKRYRATDLARALVHMDPFMTSGLTEAPLADHMLLVLMDEMNLARVEYYFSEFLSRLEVRPRWEEAGDEDRRRGACLPIDIRGRKEGPIQLFPSHNVLFAGTMNDDESTQALSDKVLDRGNLMQFAAPNDFAQPVPVATVALPSGHRSFHEWRSWIKPVAGFRGADRERAERVIQELAGIMEECGRPFGHRLNEAMLTYVFNYPRGRNDTIDHPLADQVEFRILPKLRGLGIDDHQTQLDRLRRLIAEDIRDTSFAERLSETIDRQRQASGQFNWRGLDRS